MAKRYFYILAVTVAAVLGTGCSKEGPGNGTEDAMVTVVIKSPGAGSSAARALTVAQENAVNRIDVLVFKPGGEYYTRAMSNNITDESDSRYKKFAIRLPVGNFDLVFLANARDIVGDASDGFKNKTKAEVQAMLETTLPSGDKWPGDGSLPFPMWGERDNVQIVEGFTITDAVHLLRMVSRVDVIVSATDFRMQSIDVYNYNTRGAVAPDPDALTLEGTAIRAKLPTIPAGATVTPGPVSYTSEIAGNKCVQEIYLLEAANLTGGTTLKELTDRTCLVVGGVWDEAGDGTYSGPTTYYRVDFCNADIYMDVVRNKHFEINIKKVGDHGHEDSGKAFLSGPANISTEIISWDENMDEVVFNGNYTIGVTPSVTILPGRDASGSINVKTDAPYFSFELSESKTEITTTKPDWITFTQTPGTTIAGSTAGVELEYTLKNNYSDTDWVAYVHINPQGGSKTLVATVTQEFYKARASDFALSNISMDHNGNLRFATYRAQTMRSNFQGLQFKYGSLVGLSCDTDEKDTNYTSTHVVFTPDGYTLPLYYWTSIPYYQGYNQSDDEFLAAFPGVGYSIEEGIGDICRYITDQGWVEGSWRLPTYKEFEQLYEVSTFVYYSPTDWAQHAISCMVSGNTGRKLWGEQVIENGWWFGMAPSHDMERPEEGTIFLSAGGTRMNTTGQLRYHGSQLNYWSSSASSASEAYRFYGSGHNRIDPSYSTNRSYAFAVRCIRDYQNE